MIFRYDILDIDTYMIWLQAILNGFFHDFPQAVKQAAESIVGAAVEIYNRMSAELLPTPAKSHYVFNLRDLSKCVQGKKCTVGPEIVYDIALIFHIALKFWFFIL